MTDQEVVRKIVDTDGEIRVMFSKDGCWLTVDGDRWRLDIKQAGAALEALDQMRAR